MSRKAAAEGLVDPNALLVVVLHQFVQQRLLHHRGGHFVGIETLVLQKARGSYPWHPMAVWGNMVENPIIWGAGWSKRHWHEGTTSHEASECTKLGQWFYLSCHVRRNFSDPNLNGKIRESKLRTKLHAFGIIVSAVIREDRISNPGGGTCTPPGPWIILDPVQHPPCQMRRFAQIISPEVEIRESSKKLAPTWSIPVPEKRGVVSRPPWHIKSMKIRLSQSWILVVHKPCS